MVQRSKKRQPRDGKTTEDRKFISVTEVEERYFPNLSRRKREDEPLDAATRRKVEDALADIQSGIQSGTH